MRQETVNIYTISDHPEPEKCLEWIRDNWHDIGQHYVEEMACSLIALKNEINGNLDYALSIVPDRGEYVRLTSYDENALKSLYAKKDDCPLTGVCYDIYVIEGLYNGDLENVVLSILHAEGEHIYSDEGLREMCEANEYEFLANGEFH